MENNDNKDILSQEEIDALLKGDGSSEGEESQDASTDASTQENEEKPPEGAGQTTDQFDVEISDVEKDAIGEIGNISFGTAATTLSVLLNKQVEITTPKVTITNYSELKEKFPKPHVLVEVEYTEGLKGFNVLIIKMKDAKIIADLMMGGDGHNVSGDDVELEEFHLSAVSEAMNQMMGSASTSMSTMFNEDINISPPNAKIIDMSEAEAESSMPEEPMVKVAFDLKIEGLIDSEIMQLIPAGFAKEMASQLLGIGGEESQSQKEPETEPSESAAAVSESQVSAALGEQETKQQPQQQPEQQPVEEQPVGQQMSQPAGQAQHQQQPMGQQPPMQQPPMQQQTMQQQAEPQKDYQPVEFSSLEEQRVAAPQVDTSNMDLILDVTLEVTVELGRTKKSIKEVLELVPGSIIELEKLAGEPVDIKVNDKLIAKGEVVVIDENFGIRVTEIVSKLERVNKLQ